MRILLTALINTLSVTDMDKIIKCEERLWWLGNRQMLDSYWFKVTGNDTSQLKQLLTEIETGAQDVCLTH